MEKSKTVSPAVALTTGIISVLTILFYYISIPNGILAIVFGMMARKKTGSGVGLAGMILGIVGLSLCALVYIFFITGIILARN